MTINQYICEIVTDPCDIKRIDEYLAQKDDLSFCASPMFDALISKYTQQKTYRLVVKDNKDIIATLGLTHIKSAIFGNRLVSTGFFTNRNFYADDIKAQDLLLKKAASLAGELSVAYIEYKQIDLADHKNIIVTNNIYANFIREIPQSLEDILSIIPRKKRADIRTALKNEDLTFIDNISFDDFYSLYTLSQKNLGTPVQSKRFYKELYDLDHSLCCGIAYKGKIIAVCMSFYNETSLIAYYGGANFEARRLHGYDALYYHLMVKTAKMGIKYFDFGRSRYDSGPFRYKKFWGFTPDSICHSYDKIQQKPLPENRPDNKKFEIFITLWKKLPLWMANQIGPFIMKYLG